MNCNTASTILSRQSLSRWKTLASLSWVCGVVFVEFYLISASLSAEKMDAVAIIGKQNSSPTSAVVEISGFAHRIISPDNKRLIFLVSRVLDSDRVGRSPVPDPYSLSLPHVRGEIKQLGLSRWRGSSLCAMIKTCESDELIFWYALISRKATGSEKGGFSIYVQEVYRTADDFQLLALNGDHDGDKITALIGKVDSSGTHFSGSDKPVITHGVAFYSACPVPGAIGVSVTEFQLPARK